MNAAMSLSFRMSLFMCGICGVAVADDAPPFMSSSVAFKSTSSTIASAENDGPGNDPREVHHIQVYDPRPSLFKEQKTLINQVAYSPDGSRLAAALNSNVAEVYDAGTGKVVSKAARHNAGVHSLAYSPDGKAFVSGDGAGKVEVQAAKDSVIDAQNKDVTAIAFIDNNTFGTANGESGEVILWTIGGAGAGSITGGPRLGVYSLAVSSDGKKMAMGGQADKGGQVVLFTLENNNGRDEWKPKWSADVGGDRVRGVSFDPKTNRIAVAVEKSVLLLDLKDGSTQKTIINFTTKCYSVAFRSDGVEVAAGGDDGRNGTPVKRAAP